MNWSNDLCMNVDSSITQNIQKVGTTQCPSTDEWISKLTYVKDSTGYVVYPYKGIFDHKKERSTDTCYNMDET